ncbi:response regulator [Sorangium sp. So ce1000]|uniref:response regulator n=1 Tax=Sorangium sp. So ce1000 TaxID=3133325 RepID=UPI003F64761E
MLFVDDALDTRDMVRTFVEERKARVRLAGSGEEALRLLELERPDVLVSDIGMRGMDGYELIRRVRALPQERGGDVPAAALTAYAGNEDRTRALLAGFPTHLAKPMQPTELLMAIGVLAARGEKGAAAGSQRGGALAIEAHDEAQASAGMENQNAEPTSSRPRRLSSSRCGP